LVLYSQRFEWNTTAIAPRDNEWMLTRAIILNNSDLTSQTSQRKNDFNINANDCSFFFLAGNSQRYDFVIERTRAIIASGFSAQPQQRTTVINPFSWVCMRESRRCEL